MSHVKISVKFCSKINLFNFAYSHASQVTSGHFFFFPPEVNVPRSMLFNMVCKFMNSKDPSLNLLTGSEMAPTIHNHSMDIISMNLKLNSTNTESTEYKP